MKYEVRKSFPRERLKTMEMHMNLTPKTFIFSAICYFFFLSFLSFFFMKKANVKTRLLETPLVVVDKAKLKHYRLLFVYFLVGSLDAPAQSDAGLSSTRNYELKYSQRQTK